MLLNSVNETAKLTKSLSFVVCHNVVMGADEF